MRVALRAAVEWIGYRLNLKASSREEATGVFVSYAHEDEQAVKSVAAELDRRGIKAVWFAPNQLRPGNHLDLKIRKAIDQAKYFLIAVTQQCRNSSWVAKEIEYAKQREKKMNLRLIPLYLTSRDVPESLRDYKAIDIREYVYKAGFEELADELSGKLSRGRTPLSKFEQFIDSLPIVDQEVESAIDSVRTERYCLARSTGESEDAVKYRQDTEANIRQKLRQKLRQIETLLGQKELPSLDRERIMGVLNRGKNFPPCLLGSELQDVRRWLRFATPATLAVASFLYWLRNVGSPSGRILKESLVHLINAWVNRGEIPQREAPDPDALIQWLIEEKLIRPFKRREYVNEPDDEFQEFHEGALLRSVGKAAYLFEINDPDRPSDNYPIGRFPGSTPKEHFA